MYCSKCGTWLPEDVNFCSYCGIRINKHISYPERDDDTAETLPIQSAEDESKKTISEIVDEIAKESCIEEICVQEEVVTTPDTDTDTEDVLPYLKTAYIPSEENVTEEVDTSEQTEQEPEEENIKTVQDVPQSTETVTETETETQDDDDEDYYDDEDPEFPPAPDKKSIYAPLGIGGYLLAFFISLVPVIGFIVMLVWACGGAKNKNRNSFAAGMVILKLIPIIVCAIAAGVLALINPEYLSEIFNWIVSLFAI